MSRHHTYHRPSRRRGVTLIELILTLCVLAAVGAMAWPILARGLTTWRLKAAADAVRASLATARVEAMSTGQTWQFRYSPGDGGYEIAEESSEPIQEAAESSSEDAPPAAKKKAKRLPDGIIFAEPDIVAPLAEDAEGGQPIASVGFLPDGSSSGGTVTLQNDRGRRITLSIRGLTGVVRVGDVETGAGEMQ